MAVNKQISIDKMVVIDKVFIKSVNDYREKVLQTVHWTCKLIDEDSGIEEKVCGSTYFQYPEDGFIEYSELTKTQVLSWLENHPDIEYKVSKIKDRFDNKVQNQTVFSSSILSFDSLPD